MEELAAIQNLFKGQNLTITFEQAINLLAGNPIAIPVQPFNTAVGGKQLTIALSSNALEIQLH